jgi:nucleotide-binding universal stress UspA family protein
MYRVILVPLDGTDLSRHALPWALALARPARASLRLVHVLVPLYPTADGVIDGAFGPTTTSISTGPAEREEVRRELDGLAARLGTAAGLDVAVAIEEGDPADAIRRHAGAHGVELIVMATHARGALGRALLGSVAESVLHDGGLPVLLVHPHRAGRVPDETEPATVRHVLVPLDGLPGAEAILPHAGALCAATGAMCTLLHVSLPMLATGIAAPAALVDEATERENEAAAAAYLEGLARRVRGGWEGVSVSMHVASGHKDAEAAIVAFAGTHAVDLIAMATHHRRGLARALVGSTAGSLLHDTALPMLLLRVRSA